MADLTLDLGDLTKTESRDPVGTKTTVVHEEITEKIPKERIPSNWEIKAVQGSNNISATSRLGDKFTGTAKEFNAILRG